MANTNTTERINFATSQLAKDYPDFLDIQVKSFQDFFQLQTKAEERGSEGLYKTFMDNFPITDTRNQFVLEFLDYFIDPPRYTIQECIERGLTYSVPLKARLKLYCTDPEHEDFETIVQDVYLGTIPYMTQSGTFIINGAERVVVSQLHRSPGVFFGQSFHANGTKLYSARVIPFKGSWIEFATDINQVMYAYIDRKKKLPVTTLFRAIGFERDKDILEIFDLAEEIKVSKTGLKKVLGRKLAARVLKTWFEDFVDEDTGEVVSIERNEIIFDRDTILEKEHIDEIIDSGAKTILLHKEDNLQADYAIIHNTLQKDPTNSHSFKNWKDKWTDPMFDLIKECLNAKFHVTVDVDPVTVPEQIKQFLSNPKFSLTYAIVVPNINKIKGTINIKLDDEDFEATNTGVWSTTIESIKVPNNYTGWDDYKKDKPV